MDSIKSEMGGGTLGGQEGQKKWVYCTPDTLFGSGGGGGGGGGSVCSLTPRLKPTNSNSITLNLI